MSKLMVSVSGIRGIVGETLTPQTIVKFTSAYAQFSGKGKIVIGRDARITGDMVKNIVEGTLLAKGNDVVDIGICPTPTVLYNVKKLGAIGGIMISASHNPNEWNALKLLNRNGEFMTPEENKELLDILSGERFEYSRWDKIGKSSFYKDGLKNHIRDVLQMSIIDVDLIRGKNFKVLVDCVNGAGSFFMKEFLEELNCKVIEKDCEKNGVFPRLPEPIPENLTGTIQAVKDNNVDLGIVVDPDVDRLVLLTNNGELFIEENTIVQAVQFVLSKKKGNVVVNLSTTRGVDDVAESFGCKVYRSPVGEANVVKRMKEVEAVIGGEGSGGVIYPEAVFGRDAITGTALTLQRLAEFGGTSQELKNSLPKYEIAKAKISLGKNNPDEIVQQLTEKYSSQKINTEDGLRIDFEDHWAHLRKSNTEPIIRCIVEAKDKAKSNSVLKKYVGEIEDLLM
ncbi:MAG: phosphoglucosamine mutase [Chlorobi bacterium]|nr:phosphoglucosamine mutase [Chlorobiota bacterium]